MQQGRGVGGGNLETKGCRVDHLAWKSKPHLRRHVQLRKGLGLMLLNQQGGLQSPEGTQRVDVSRVSLTWCIKYTLTSEVGKDPGIPQCHQKNAIFFTASQDATLGKRREGRETF